MPAKYQPISQRRHLVEMNATNHERAFYERRPAPGLGITGRLPGRLALTFTLAMETLALYKGVKLIVM